MHQCDARVSTPRVSECNTPARLDHQPLQNTFGSHVEVHVARTCILSLCSISPIQQKVCVFCSCRNILKPLLPPAVRPAVFATSIPRREYSFCCCPLALRDMTLSYAVWSSSRVRADKGLWQHSLSPPTRGSKFACNCCTVSASSYWESSMQTEFATIWDYQ